MQKRTSRYRLLMTNQDICNCYAKQIGVAVRERTVDQFPGLDHCLFAVINGNSRQRYVAFSMPPSWGSEDSLEVFQTVLQEGTYSNDYRPDTIHETVTLFARGFYNRLWEDRKDDARIVNTVMCVAHPEGFFALAYICSESQAYQLLSAEFAIPLDNIRRKRSDASQSA